MITQSFKKNLFYLIAGSIALLFFTVYAHIFSPSTAYAAPARCYQITGSGDSRTAQQRDCPAPNPGVSGLGATIYSDGGPLDTEPATCYFESVAGGLGGVQYFPRDCTVILAPAARCYTAEYELFASCPPPGAFGISYSDGGPSGANCYQQGTGERLTIMTRSSCDNIVRIGQCQRTGGEWRAFQSAAPGAIDGQVYRCVCPANHRLAGNQCVEIDETAAPETETECISRGGTWQYAGTASGGIQYGGYCSGWQDDGGDGDGDGAGDPAIVAEEPEADCDDPSGNLNEDNCKVVGLLNTFLNFVAGGVTLAVIGNIVMAGIQYSTAQGNPSTSAAAKKRITTAVMAFIMFLSLYAFIQWLIPGGVF